MHKSHTGPSKEQMSQNGRPPTVSPSARKLAVFLPFANMRGGSEFYSKVTGRAHRERIVPERFATNRRSRIRT